MNNNNWMEKEQQKKEEQLNDTACTNSTRMPIKIV